MNLPGWLLIAFLAGALVLLVTGRRPWPFRRHRMRGPVPPECGAANPAELRRLEECWLLPVTPEPAPREDRP